MSPKKKSPAARRTQADRTAATRAQLIQSATQLFAEHGYADVGTELLVEVCGLTRGALYHHFDGKRGLFEAVVDDVQSQIATEIDRAANRAPNPKQAIKAGSHTFLKACARPDVRQILLVDAPSVIGIDRWREIDTAHGVASLIVGLTACADAGILAPQPIEPLARLISGALNEASLWLAEKPNSTRRRQQTRAAVDRLLDTLIK